MESQRGLKGAGIRYIGAVLGAMLLAACSGPFGSGQSAQPERSATLQNGTLMATVSATGAIQAETEVRLVFQTTGRVTEVNVMKGDVVRKGDVLARLDTTDLQAALAQAQAGLIIASAAYSRTVEGPRAADITAAQSALNTAYANYSKLQAGPDKADIAAAETAVRSAEAALRQAQTANDLTYQYATKDYPGSPVITQLEQARNNLETAKQQYDRVLRGPDQAQTAAALQQIASARAQLDKLQQPARQYSIDQAMAERRKAQLQIEQAQRRLDQAVLVAPLDAVVSAVNIKEGEDAGATAQPAVALVDTSTLHVDITVDEIDVAKVHPGLDVAITLDALPGVELKGTVDRVAATSTNVSGVVSYAVRVVLVKTDAPLRVGMTANASVVLDKRDNVLLAPNWAIRKDKQSGKAYLTIKVDDKTKNEVEVKTGLRNENFSEIVSGASAGQAVVAPQVTNLLGQ
ncbi:MAG: HlyD family efflux transporter periplasmic adaptor subunit [Chloroflexi bacterium]|nr:HlyD family efflux transporter periplasmic adaptor subunit [Chloroflexota bacterium]MCL5275890.1 HlyD family efflux transporter periplasmic adaptor subunit [Chloroflexota bacterium]